uniref:Uncharacterized protein n=1 Tax=Nelumbo nucifera TaxID=4432 RepID=A0A822ZTC4_NELNU|nr:TPA_asm: hypothetical protein HUJ06_018120 [Nelumbo nucifera]
MATFSPAFLFNLSVLLMIFMVVIGTSAARLGPAPEEEAVPLMLTRDGMQAEGLQNMAFHVLVKGGTPPSAPSGKGHGIIPTFTRRLLKTSPRFGRRLGGATPSVPSPGIGH